ncbi:MAG: ABC transporter ATP-binding protein [Pseudomonadota bacterium]|jgi:iron(III) transport system ATP-binding protein|nr:ABC transporter ATP-binding protein [Pseudomonadota bacterium]|tara:strand:+ start:491 stop:1534 length:1044 start_codon:yes stop_codon:yes gene_type:complete
MNNAIEIRELSLSIEDRSILNNISFNLGEIDIACLLGPSGCGKTSLLRCIAGFEKPNKGEVLIKGVITSNPNHYIPVEERNIGMVFQDYVLFPHMCVSENIIFGLKNLQQKRIKQRLDELIELLDLGDQINKFPHQLSGGQQQRVALARAMAPRPGVLLLDEPFASLDIELREQLAHELRSILKQDGITTIMVTHNQLEAFAMADVIGVMRDGKLRQWDTAFNLYHIPKTLDVADFVGEGVFISGEVINNKEVKTDIGNIKGYVPDNLTKGEKVRVLIRPDDILHDDDSEITAVVISKAFRGAEFLYTLEMKNGLHVQSLVPSHHDHPINEPIGIKLEIDHLVIFAD